MMGDLGEGKNNGSSIFGFPQVDNKKGTAEGSAFPQFLALETGELLKYSMKIALKTVWASKSREQVPKRGWRRDR